MEALSHPNIVKMYEAFQSEDKKTIQFVMEYAILLCFSYV